MGATMNRVKEVIVVEGRADTEAIRHAVDADTIETNGSALPEETLAAIQLAAQTRGVIVFTDPDFNGERLRKLIAAQVPDVKHAFLTKSEAGLHVKHHSLGIEYAQPDDIQQALSQVYTLDKEPSGLSDITRADLRKLGLLAGANAASKRQALAEYLHLGYVNGKQLYSRLHMFGLKLIDVQQALLSLGEDKGKENE
ncbi:hypothetical protein IV68_GL001309 [Weissella halotolerans DSM 20190]|uniref:Ribonuclease M5 n=2 Tax=Weissella halotolerans TaxID=1615 RepID=A0A0R2FPL8_9LACO|nr:hypothetical protein IV68_GL001309 [Weissella halotolerans DSM 20190]